MAPRGKNTIRIEYDRTGQNEEILPYWPQLEDRPYYDLEKRYSKGEGPDIMKFYDFKLILKFYHLEL